MCFGTKSNVQPPLLIFLYGLLGPCSQFSARPLNTISDPRSLRTKMPKRKRSVEDEMFHLIRKVQKLKRKSVGQSTVTRIVIPEKKIHQLGIVLQGFETKFINQILLPNDSLTNVSSYVSQLRVHGTKVSRKSGCECTQGYSDDRCDVSLCYNYCLQEDCSTSAEGQLKCRCNAVYFGARCGMNTCQGYCRNSGDCSLNEECDPVYQWTGGCEGDRCDVSVYCFQRDCCSSAAGQLRCRCNPGYTRARCEVNTCPGYSQNNCVCSLNENSEPVCQCTGDYEGARCNVPKHTS